MAFRFYNSNSINCGGYGSVDDFLATNIDQYINSLKSFMSNDLDLKVGEEQIIAWKDSYSFLREGFERLIQVNPKYNRLYIAFEYAVPMEGSRRPDLLLFSKDKVILFQFKRKSNYSYDDIEQVIGFKRDLSNYHKETNKQGLEVISYLVLTRAITDYGSQDGVKILNKDNFVEELNSLNLVSSNKELVEEWLKSDYEALLSIMKATLNLFEEGELPEIKSIEEGEIKETIDYLKEIIYHNEVRYKQKNLVFVTGMPGSGKTLAALKVLYDYNKYKLEQYRKPLSAIYLSRNGPLTSLLQSILDDGLGELGETGKSYVRSMRSYKYEHMNNPKVPLENVVIFDEAQRAWGEKRMKENDSEADVLLKTGHKIYRNQGNVTIICFIGVGEVIYTGEEEGIRLWQKALSKRGINDWNVYSPLKYKNLFSDAVSVTMDKRLNLDCSIRSHFIDTSLWIESLLESNFDKARKAIRDMYQQGLIIRVSRDFERIKKFIKKKEAANKEISYGLVVSSKARDKDIKYKINGGRYFGSFMKPNEVGQWFRGENKDLTKGASEFACQGLELDYPLVCFGGDYYYNGREWEIEESIERYNSSKYKDFAKIIENIYRVLLSRARKGMVLYIPKIDRLDKTYQVLVESGVREL